MLGVELSRPVTVETTALGAAYLAGLAVGFWNNLEELELNREVDRVFKPQMDKAIRDKLYAGWKRAVKRSMGWATASE